MTPTRLSDHPIHLGLGATAEIEPEFTGAMEWYAGYSERHGADGAEGRLVTVHDFDSDWDVWEMHPVGSEGRTAPPASPQVSRKRATDPDRSGPATVAPGAGLEPATS